MDYERITIDPAKMRGVPCIRGLRVPVATVIGQLAAGRTAEEILTDFPDLEADDIPAALEYAAAAVLRTRTPAHSPSVRFLVDANLSPQVARLLTAAGYDAVAVRDLGLQDAPDDEILDRALLDDRIIISHDTDFGTLLAVRRQSKPSFVLVRSADPLTANQVAELIIDNLSVMSDDLTAGAIATFARGHLRSRRLPLR